MRWHNSVSPDTSCGTSTVPPGQVTVSLVTFCVATVHFVSPTPTHSTARSDRVTVSPLKEVYRDLLWKSELAIHSAAPQNSTKNYSDLGTNF